jgi:ankyrin repeat protein
MTIDRTGRDHLANAVIDRDMVALKRLLAENCDPNHSDHAGWTPLHFAAQNNDEEAVRMLLKCGASTSVSDEYGNTPLWRAVFSYRGGSECISALLEAGADPDVTNNHGVSPRSLAHTIANNDARKVFE